MEHQQNHVPAQEARHRQLHPTAHYLSCTSSYAVSNKIENTDIRCRAAQQAETSTFHITHHLHNVHMNTKLIEVVHEYKDAAMSHFHRFEKANPLVTEAVVEVWTTREYLLITSII